MRYPFEQSRTVYRHFGRCHNLGLAIWYGGTDCWWTVNEADKVDDHASDGCYDMMANRRLHAPRMRDKQPDCDCG